MAKFELLYFWYGKKYGVHPNLLRAIAIVESGQNPYAVNPTDPSYGLMQIRYTGSNNLNVENWPPEDEFKLFNPAYNVSIGAQIIAWNIKTYGLLKGIAIYNNWGARNDPDNGPFRNQEYVRRVLVNYVGEDTAKKWLK